MTVQELDTMVNAMRTSHHKVVSRIEVTDTLFYLWKGVHAIKRNDLAEMLLDLYTEIDGIDTDELIKMGTFR